MPYEAGLWYPSSGVPTYGNVDRYRPGSGAVPSARSDAAPSGVNDGSTSGIVAPATALSSIATMSSKTRRPLGKPAGSPATRPIGLGLVAGGTARLSRNRSAGFLPVKFWN